MDTKDIYQRWKEQLFLSALEDVEEDSLGEDDKTFRKRTKKQITARDQRYSDLLSHFVCVTRIRNYLKEIFKWLFCLAVIASIVVLIVLICMIFGKYINVADMEQMKEGLPLLVTSMVGFVSAIITIPVTITKYLFSTKEDENITKIIMHTQEHDVLGRNWATDLKKVFDESGSLREKKSTSDSA